MTIDIQAPDGSIARFPDGTPDDTITDVMRRTFGGPADTRVEATPDMRPTVGKGGTPTLGQRLRDPFTGELRTDFPDAPEFAAALRAAELAGNGSGGLGTRLNVRALSAVTPDPAAQLDIIKRAIPDVESRPDAFGNLMLRAPSQGVTDWTYLNKPGLSARDVDEFMAQTVPTLPFAPLYGAGRSIAARVGTGAVAGAAGSVAQDVAATALGSDQGVDPTRAAAAGVIGGALGPLGRRPAAAPGGAPRAGELAAEETPRPTPAPAPEAPGPSTAPRPQGELGIPEPATPQVAPAPQAGAPQAASWELGRPTQVVTPDSSMSANATPQVVELSDLRLARGDLQPRDRTGRSEYTLGARERANSLDPERLMPSRVSDVGAPIVMDDGTVISGNGRVMSINEVYKSPALRAQADAYRARLGTAAAGMREPVLVMRLGPMAREDAVRFADLSNRPAVAAMSVTERAGRDARALGPEGLALFQGGDFEAPQNLPFLRAFMEKAVTPAERASVSMNNRLTREGADRMRAAVLHAAYEDSPTISRMLESTDDNIRNITGALTDAAPRMAQLRADVKAGLVPAEMDASSMLSEAVRLIGDLRNRGISPAQYFAQQDAFKTANPMAESWVQAFYNDGLTRPISREKMAAVLNAYADEARLHQTGGLFADETTASDVLGAARKVVARDEASEVAQGGVVSGNGAGNGQGGPAIPRPTATGGGTGPAGGGGQAAGDIGAADARLNASEESLGPRQRQQGVGQEPVNRYLEQVATEPRRIPAAPTRNELAQAATAEGIKVPNVIARNDFVRRLAGGLGNTYVGTPLATAGRKASEAIGERLQAVGSEFSDLSSRSAGEVARKGLAEWIATDGRGSEIVQGLYQRVNRVLKGRENALNPLPETKRVFDDLASRQAAAASELNEPALRLVRDALDRQGGLTFQGLADLRTQIGHLIDGTIMPAPGTPMPALKRLYGALSEDLRASANRLGGDRAVQALDRANGIASMVAERRQALADIVGAKGDEAPEVVISRLLRLADGRGGKGDAASLLKARRVLGDDWDAVSGAAIRQLGQEGDTFSVRKFLTRYENLSPNGRQLLFRSSGKDNLADSLDNLALLSRKFDELARMGNPSGTGNVEAVIASITGMFIHPLHALQTIGGGWLIAQALARPLTAKEASRWANAYLVNATAPTRNAMASLNLATQMFARSMAREGMGEEDDLRRKLDAASRGQR
jgi:hypothetical protein